MATKSTKKATSGTKRGPAAAVDTLTGELFTVDDGYRVTGAIRTFF